MRSARRAGGLLLAVTVSALVVAPSPTSGAAPARPGVDAVSRGMPRTVTLVTGDQVRITVDGRHISVTGVVPGKGRTRVSFVAMQGGGHVRVVPSDALPLLRAGRLDARLFDITTLVGFGYDDRRKDLPLIVTGDANAVRGRTSGAVRTVPGGGAVRPAKPDLSTLWPGLAGGLTTRSAGLSKVWLDGLRRPSLDVSVPLIGAPAAWAAGYTGTGVTVSVVDTGVDAAHPDLAGRVAAAEDFTGAGNTLDEVGHGTHVAATIASNDTRYRGVAPDVRLLSAKVCADFGCEESAILAGMQWSVEHGAKVVNMSLGGTDTPEQDPLEAAVEDLTTRFGALFVIAAGNAGGEQTVDSPGSADSALTVGAVDKADELAGFSSRGPRVGDAAIKPDVTAPGVDIVAARSKDGGIGNPGESHVAISGTSMATPHAAGAAAILAQQHPTWTPLQLKAALMGSAKPAPAIDVYAQGAGRIDVARAITTSVLADPPSVSFGRQLWPHADDVPDPRVVTYRNTGSSAVTLDLSLTGGAPAGLFTLSASTLTVPAGGTASVTLTSDTRADVADARYTGSLVAQAGTTRLAVPFAVEKEVESYTLTPRHLDRSGQPTEDFFTGLLDPATGTFLQPVANEQAMRVPKGNYAIISGIFGPDLAATMLLEPEIAVDRDVRVTLDARHGRPVTVSVPLPDAAPVFVVAAADIMSTLGNLTGIVFGAPDSVLYAGSADPRRRSPALHSLILAQYTKDGADPLESPYFAQVTWRETGRMFPGFTKRLKPGELAVIHAEHAADHPAGGFLQLRPVWPEGFVSPLGPGSQLAVPGSRVEYYNTDDGIEWIRTLFVSDADDPALTTALVSLSTRFEGGRHYPEKRNFAVTGPGFSHINSPEGWLSRRGDTFSFLPILANDQLNWFGATAATDSLRFTLDRNGRRVFEGTDATAVDVAPGAANYRLGVELTRSGPGTLSTSVSCVWTFRSGTVRDDVGVPLPLSVVRFLPRVDNRNTAPAGQLFAVPVQIQRQRGSAAGPARTLDVEVSYDGATWQRVPVIRFGQTGLVLLNHPAGPGFVSLRASSTDSAGRTVTETIIHAYRLA